MKTIQLSDQEVSILCLMLGMLRGKLSEDEFSMEFAWVTDRIIAQTDPNAYTYSFKKSVVESATWEEMSQTLKKERSTREKFSGNLN